MITDVLKRIGVRGDLTFYICITVVLILPVYVYFLPPFIILWVLAWLFEKKFQTERNNLNNKLFVLLVLFIVFFLWQISGLVVSDSPESGFTRIIKRISFLLFPLVLYNPGEKITKNINLILKLFALATFIYVVYCLTNALNNSLTFQDGNWIFNVHPSDYDYENYFISTRFSAPLHPSYLSAYLILSVLISLEAVFEINAGKLKKGLWFILTVLFLVSIYLASSRAGIIATVIILPIYLYFRFKDRLLKKILYVAATALIIALIFVAKTNERFSNDLNIIKSDTVQKFIEQDVRYTIWRSACNVIKENPVIGVGTGDASAELKKEFKSLGYENGYYDDLNAHNQFIEVMLENGIIGLILFLLLLGYMIFLAYREDNLLYGLFILMMIIFFLFETVLNRQAGVTFFPLFAFLLYYNKRVIE